MIGGVPNITPIVVPELNSISPAAGKSGEFSGILESTITSLESLNHDASNAVQQFLTGDNEELHTTILATQKASLAFELGLAVRNKVVEAYQEVMKMQL